MFGLVVNNIFLCEYFVFSWPFNFSIEIDIAFGVTLPYVALVSYCQTFDRVWPRVNNKIVIYKLF